MASDVQALQSTLAHLEHEVEQLKGPTQQHLTKLRQVAAATGSQLAGAQGGDKVRGGLAHAVKSYEQAIAGLDRAVAELTKMVAKAGKL